MMAKNLRLLLIEDSEDDAVLAVEELRNGGFDPYFTRVDTPQTLATALENGDWDAVIADYNLPSFTGIDALRIVQAKGMDLPLLLVSGAIGEELAAEAMKAGFHDVIMKGHYSRLTQALERELREVMVRRERKEALEELRRAHTELEQRVAERTAELVIAHKKAEDTNDRLRREIHERKQAEVALREEDRYLRTILQTTADGFWVVDLEGKITQVNEAYCRMSGYTCDELLKLNVSAIDAVEEPAATSAHIQRPTAKGSEIFETRHRRKDGSVFHVEISATYMNTGSGKFVCFCRDITERKQAEEMLRRRAEDMRISNEELTRFTRASVGRELRMIELKQEVNILCVQAGLPSRYTLDSEESQL